MSDEIIPDGLCLPCGKCEKHTAWDYVVEDGVWQRNVPENLKLGVVCLECFDEMCAEEYQVIRIWFVGKNSTFRIDRPQRVKYRLGKRHLVSLQDMFPNLNV